MTASFKPPIGTLGSGRYAPYAQRPDGRFVHHVGGHKLGIDRMSSINSAFGLEGGDILINIVAETLSEVFPFSPMIARIRGRYFAVLTPMSADEIEALVPKLGKVVSEKFAGRLGLARTNMLSSCSVGCLEVPTDAKSVDEALRLMEIVRDMLGEEHPGSFRTFVSTDLKRQVNLSSMPFKIANALEAGNFHLYVQPKENLHTGRCSGGEFLIRWTENGKPVESPHVFIPVAEGAGLIRDIGLFTFREACRLIQSLPTEQRALKFAINASALELRNRGYSRTFLEHLEVYGINTDQMEIEITESSISHIDSIQLKNLEDLRSAGIKIALDDFGTGTSSLSALYGLPIDRVKLDRSFLCDIETNPTREVFVGRAIDLAKSLGKEVTVEGVETQKIRDIIMLLGADEIQGYFYARPQPFDQFNRFITERS